MAQNAVLKQIKPQTVTSPSGDKMVLLSAADFDLLIATARGELEDAEDATDAARILARLESGDETTLPFSVVKRLGRENPIKVLREHRGLTQVELAAKAGTDPAYVSQLETGRALGSPAMIAKIAAALGVASGIIFGRQYPMAEAAAPRARGRSKIATTCKKKP